MENLPLYDLFINEHDEEELIVSFVNSPAVGYKWQMFSNVKPQKFAINEEKRLVSGVFITANAPIYRKDKNGFEYFVRIPKVTIDEIVLKMAKKGFGFGVNLEHSEKANNIYLTELFQIDRERGMLPNAFKSVPDGSLVGTFKVENNKIWDDVKNGVFKGFSIESNFLHKEVGETNANLAIDIIKVIQNL